MLIRSVSDWNGGRDDGRPLVRQHLFVGNVQIGALQFAEFEQWLEWMSILRNTPEPHMIKFEGNAEVTRAECIWTEIDRLDLHVRIKSVTNHIGDNPHVVVNFLCPSQPKYVRAAAFDLPTALQGILNNLKEM